MAFFRRRATVAHHRRNLTIFNILSITDPVPAELSVADMRHVYSKALVPPANLKAITNQTDSNAANKLLYQLGYTLRLYHADFPADLQRPLDVLRGFLAVPVVFSTTVWTYANQTTTRKQGLVPIPPDLETTASGAVVTLRVIAGLWTVITFDILVAVLVVWSGSIYFYIWWNRMINKIVSPNTSSFGEIDVSAKTAYAAPMERGLTEHGVPDGNSDWSSMLRDAGLGNAESRAIINVIQGQRVRVANIDGVQKLILVTAGDGVQFSNKFTTLSRGVRYL